MNYNVYSEILKDIEVEELPEPYKSIASTISMPTALNLAYNYQGSHIYFPKLDALVRKKRNERIQKEFNGYNFTELAVKYGLTDRSIRKIVDLKSDDTEQTSIDDFL